MPFFFLSAWYYIAIVASMYCYLSVMCWVMADFHHLCHLKQPRCKVAMTPLSVLSTSTLLYEIDKCIGYWLSPMPTSTSIHPSPGPLPCPLSASCPAGGGGVSVWQALGPVRWPVGCDGQQLRVPLPAVWRPLGSRPGAQPAKVTSLQLRGRQKNQPSYGPRFTPIPLSTLPKVVQTNEPTQATLQLQFIIYTHNNKCFFLILQQKCWLMLLDNLTSFCTYIAAHSVFTDRPSQMCVLGQNNHVYVNAFTNRFLAFWQLS